MSVILRANKSVLEDYHSIIIGNDGGSGIAAEVVILMLASACLLLYNPNITSLHPLTEIGSGRAKAEITFAGVNKLFLIALLTSH
jgi:hypothetical protein